MRAALTCLLGGLSPTLKLVSDHGTYAPCGWACSSGGQRVDEGVQIAITPPPRPLYGTWELAVFSP